MKPFLPIEWLHEGCGCVPLLPVDIAFHFPVLSIESRLQNTPCNHNKRQLVSLRQLEFVGVGTSVRAIHKPVCRAACFRGIYLDSFRRDRTPVPSTCRQPYCVRGTIRMEPVTGRIAPPYSKDCKVNCPMARIGRCFIACCSNRFIGLSPSDSPYSSRVVLQ